MSGESEFQKLNAAAADGKSAPGGVFLVLKKGDAKVTIGVCSEEA